MVSKEYVLQQMGDIQEGRAVVISRLEAIISRMKNEPVSAEEWEKMTERLRKTVPIAERISKIYVDDNIASA